MMQKVKCRDKENKGTKKDLSGHSELTMDAKRGLLFISRA